MDKIERLVYLITGEIKDRPKFEKFSRDEYNLLLDRIKIFCERELEKRDKQ